MTREPSIEDGVETMAARIRAGVRLGSILGALAVIAACSGDDGTSTDEPSDTTSSFARKPKGGLPGNNEAAGPRGNAGPGNAGPGNAGPGNAGPGNAGPGNAGPGNAGPGARPNFDDCSLEVEGNDSPETANVLPSGRASFCGYITSANDQDFASWVMPATSTDLYISFSNYRWGVEAEIYVDGQRFVPGATPIVRPGSTYVVRIVSSGRLPGDYRLEFYVN